MRYSSLRVIHRVRIPNIHHVRCFAQVDIKEPIVDNRIDSPKKPMDDENRIDRRVWPIAMSTFITGTAIGVALPVMPLFAAELGLSTGEFGLVGSIFGAARLLSNPPLAMLSERVGRRKFLMWGPGITAISMVGTGLSGSLPVLLGWRAISGTLYTFFSINQPTSLFT